MRYTKKFGKVPGIVFDDVNRLSGHHPKILEMLQEGATDHSKLFSCHQTVLRQLNLKVSL